MSSINQFPWQDDIIRRLRADGALTVEQIAAEITADGVESEVLEEGVALNVDHLVHLGLAEYPDGKRGPTERTPHDALFHRTVKLTPAGESAADTLP